MNTLLIPKPIKKIIHRLGRRYIMEVCKSEYEAQDWTINERAVEYSFVFDQLKQLRLKTVLDVGTGLTALPSVMRSCGCLVTATDNVTDYWQEDFVNRHYHIVHDDICKSALRQTFDVVTCISTLEHVADHRAAVGSMCRSLNPGGRLLLTFPYNEKQYYPDAYRLPDSDPQFRTLPYIGQIFSRREIADWTAANGVRIATEEYWCCYTGDLWTCGTFVRPPQRVGVDEKHHLLCLALEK